MSAAVVGRFEKTEMSFVLFAGVYSKILPYIVFGTISIMAAVVIMLLPDTRNTILPDLISQAKPLRGYVTIYADV